MAAIHVWPGRIDGGLHCARVFRAVIRWLVLALVLVSSLAYADYPAVMETGVPISEPPYNQATFSALAFGTIYQNGTTLFRKEFAGGGCPVPPVGWIMVAGYYTQTGGPSGCNTWAGYQKNQVLSCPSGGTLQGDQCVNNCPTNDYGDKPDTGGADYPMTQPQGCTCPAGSKWFPGGCRKTCASANTGDSANAGWDFIFAAGQTSGCFNSCGIQAVAGKHDQYANGSIGSRATYDGWACRGTTGSKPDPAKPPVPPADKKPPPCGGTDGVITSSSGNVLCLPAGTPDTSTPIVKKDSKVETYPDGSTKTSDTTKTTDPNTHTTDTHTSSTSTGGQSGPQGTTTSAGSGSGSGGKSGNGDGDGSCDPTLNFCSAPATDGLYEKKDKDFVGPLQEFADGVRDSVIGTSSKAFFTVTIPSAGCPAWSTYVPYLNVTVNLSEYMCNPQGVAALDAVGKVLMLIAAFAAFRWALL